jgi:hypothetical protein
VSAGDEVRDRLAAGDEVRDRLAAGDEVRDRLAAGDEVYSAWRIQTTDSGRANPMPAFELRSFFECGTATWREQAYWVGSSFSGARDAAVITLTARLQLLGFPARCTGMRIHQIGVKGSSIVGNAPLFTPSENACPPHTGLLVRRMGQAGDPVKGFYGMELLRCFPARWLPLPGNNSLPNVPAAIRAFQTWVAALIANRICITGETGSGPLYPVLALAYWAITDTDTLDNPLDPVLGNPGSALVSLGLGAPNSNPTVLPSIPAGVLVAITGVAFRGQEIGDKGRINGSRKVFGSEANVITVGAEAPPDGVWVQSGNVQMEQTVYVPITSVGTEGSAERKCGSTKYPNMTGSFPRGYIPPLLAKVVPRGEPTETVPIVTTPPPYPGSLLVTNAKDLCAVCYRGYPDVPPETTKACTLYKIANLENSYYMCCSGTDSFTNPITGIPADITNGIGLPFGFPLVIYEVIKAFVPQGSTCYLAGHSLGGMACENYLNYYAANTIQFPRIVTFGSPVVGFLTGFSDVLKKAVIKYLNFGQKARRFSTKGDLVPTASPPGFILAIFGSPELTFVSNFPYGNGPYESHVHYQELASLENWDVWGNPLYTTQFPFPGQYLYLDLVFTVSPGGS